MAIFFGGKGMDLWGGGSGNDIAFGGDGTDFLYGNGGNDVLYGGNGTDFLYGGDGQDILFGGAGRDFLSGGAGADTFVFMTPGESGTTSSTADQVTDLQWYDRFDVPDAVDYGPHRWMQTSSVSSIEQATGVAYALDIGDGARHNTAVLFSNPTQNMGYLVMDLDVNGSYETGVIINDLGNPVPTYIDFLLQ